MYVKQSYSLNKLFNFLQVEYSKQPRNKGHVYGGGYQGNPRGSSTHPYSQSDGHYGQDNPGYVSPDSEDQHQLSHEGNRRRSEDQHQPSHGGNKRRRSLNDREGYDAKALMQEEQQKYAEYKAEYVRRQSSSHSSENEDSRSDHGPHQTKRMVHHERQPALYGEDRHQRQQHPDQYLYSPTQKRRIPHEQLPATRVQHIPDMSRYPPNSYVQYKQSQLKHRHDGVRAQDQGLYPQGYVSYHDKPSTTSQSAPRKADDRHQYIREYEIPEEPIPKPKQEFVLRWGPQQKSPSVERVVGRHTPDREGSRFGPQDKRPHKRSASDGYAHQYEGGFSDRHRSVKTLAFIHSSIYSRHNSFPG